MLPTPASSTLVPTSTPTSTPPAGPTPAQLPSPRAVRPLAGRVDADVFVRTTEPVTKAQLAAALADVPGAQVTLLAVGGVALGTGSTTAVGVDPSRYRRFAPAGTAESTPLWQSVARGDVAVAHTVAKALAVPLGGSETIGGVGGTPLDFRIGALATTGLPGVGVVVDDVYDQVLDLRPDTGAVVAAPGHDPVVVAAVLEQRLTAVGATATPLRVAVGADGRGTWVSPAAGPLTQPFGPKPFDGHESFHPGIDIGAAFGAPIYAATAGTVLYAGPASGFGNEVVLQHTGGVQTVYGHMERILVTPGQGVQAGQAIALVGSLGESTGPHLHFEVHVNDQLTDPLAWLVAHGVRISR